MELVNEIVNNQFALYIPVALVLVGAILVFAFGFKSAEQPPFDKLSSIESDERKNLAKKKKLKEKKTSANGNAVSVNEGKVEKSPKNSKKKEQENVKKADSVKPKPVVEKKKPEKVVEEKQKKSSKAKVNLSVDGDDAGWEIVLTKGDKKKKQESPVKKEKKVKKSEKSPEVEKLVKEVINKELQEKNVVKEQSTVVSEEIENKGETEEIKIEPVEIKKEKKSEKKAKKADIDVIENVQKVEIPVTPPLPTKEPPSAKLEEKPAKSQEIPAKEPTGTVVFDELGDVWTEAKQPKKNKKKSRRDN